MQGLGLDLGSEIMESIDSEGLKSPNLPDEIVSISF
jgi:hypothetical protein